MAHAYVSSAEVTKNSLCPLSIETQGVGKHVIAAIMNFHHAHAIAGEQAFHE